MTYKLQVRLSDRNHMRLKEAAEEKGLPLSSYASSLILTQLDGPGEVAEAVLEALAKEPKLRYRLQRIMTVLPQEAD